MGLFDAIRRVFAPPAPIREWSVEYDRGGRAYTYRRTERAFREMLTERAKTGREWPYRITVLVDDRWVEVKIEVS